jgi:nitroreductase
MVPIIGDPEIDAAFPRRPRVLPELIWSALDNTRLLVIGTLNGLIVPKHIGKVALVDFANQVDGTQTVEELVCDADGSIDDDRRITLSLLFTRGLLEDATGDCHHAVAASTLPFLARIMDQTRVCQSRRGVLDRLCQPLGVVGAPEAVMTYLLVSGVNASACDLTQASGFELIVVFVDTGTDFASIERLNEDSQPTLLMSVQENELRIGPMLLGPGTSSVSTCREIHSRNSKCTPYADLWDIIAANSILLIHSRTAAISLLSQYVRYRRDGGDGLQSETIPLSRTCGAGLETDANERLARQTSVAVLPARYAGYKAYEIHYSPSFLEAAQLVPRAIDQDRLLPSSAANSDLLKALELAFGYRADGEALVRNCPSGGNLGSAEAMIVDFDVPHRVESLYRFVSPPSQLERIADRAWEPPPGSHSCRVIASIGNAAKLRFKYKTPLGENLAHIDAGIASAFFSLGYASLTGRKPCFDLLRTSDDILGHYLAHRKNVYALTWSAVVPTAAAGRGASGAYRQLRKVVRRRHSTRQLEPTELHQDDIAALLQKTLPRDFRQIGREIISLFRLLVFIDEPTAQLTVLLSVKDAVLKPLVLDRVADTGQTISQRLLAAAPVKIFFFVDLPELLRRFGPEGHDNALALCGAWVGALWLEVEMRGLAGCPAGAIAECEILSQLEPEIAESWFSLLCFALGKRSPEINGGVDDR